MAFVHKGSLLAQINRPQDALTVWEEIERRFWEIENPILLEPVAQALINKGVALGALNRLDDALVVWEDLARRFGASECQAHRELTERALIENADLDFRSPRESWVTWIGRRFASPWTGRLFRRNVSPVSAMPASWESWSLT